MPAALMGHVATAHNEVIVVVGGRHDPDSQSWYGETGGTSAATFRFDVQSGEWTEGATMPSARQHGVGAKVGGILYVFGGYRLEYEG